MAERECPRERSAGGFDDGDVRVQVSSFGVESLDEVVARSRDSPGEGDAGRMARGAVRATCGGVLAT